MNNVATESRFCDRCMTKTIHSIMEDEDVIYTYKRRKLYCCSICGQKSYKRGLRPSAESVYKINVIPKDNVGRYLFRNYDAQEKLHG